MVSCENNTRPNNVWLISCPIVYSFSTIGLKQIVNSTLLRHAVNIQFVCTGFVCTINHAFLVSVLTLNHKHFVLKTIAINYR